jgi:hypothetical protein
MGTVLDRPDIEYVLLIILFLPCSCAFSGAFKTLWSTYEVCSLVICQMHEYLENTVGFSARVTRPTINVLTQKRHTILAIG